MRDPPEQPPPPNMMKKQNRNQKSRSQSPSTDKAPQPPTPEEMSQRAHEIYLAHGGKERMALNDWLTVEQELEQKLGA